jgi:hypothetical protein
MAVKTLGWREARQALAASGMSGGQLLALLWPFGRGKRTRSLLLDRRTVLEAKSLVVDFLFRAQHRLADLRLTDSEGLRKALLDPEKRPLIMSLGINRAMIEEVLRSRYGAEAGRSLEKALSELIASGTILKSSPRPGTDHEVFIAVHARPRPQFALGRLNRLLQEGRDWGGELRERLKRNEKKDIGRTHRL